METKFNQKYYNFLQFTIDMFLYVDFCDNFAQVGMNMNILLISWHFVNKQVPA